MKNMQKPLRVFFLSLATKHVDHKSSNSNSGPGIVLLYMYCEPCELFLVLSAVLHFTFPFFFFFSPSSVAQTLKNFGPLDCKLRLLRRRSISLGGKISVAEFMHLTFSLQHLSELSCGFCCCCCFFFFHSFSLSLSFFLFLCGDFEQFFFLWIEVVSESESTMIETSFARQPHGASISALPSRLRVTSPWSRVLDFSVLTVFKPAKMGSTAPKPAWRP